MGLSDERWMEERGGGGLGRSAVMLRPWVLGPHFKPSTGSSVLA